MSAFNPAMQAQSTLKERVVWMIYLGIVFFLLYGSANEFASITSPHLSVFFEWERSIEFNPAFIVPYMSSDIVFISAFLLAQTRAELRELTLQVLFIVLLSVSLFIIFPLQFSFEKPATTSFTFLFNLLENDQPFNQLPSLHVSFAVVFWFSMKKHIPNPIVKTALLVWLMLIIASTLFVYQHHFLDIPTGMLVGMLAVYVIKEGKSDEIINQFMTPRHLKMGLYFLLLSILLMLLSFTVSPVFIYFFICTFSVSLIYAFGANHLLVAANGKVGIIQWLVFTPYFLGCKLSWFCYKRSQPLLAKADEGLYIGRHPSAHEYADIEKLGVKHVINLATELQLNKTLLNQHRLNFLDQTIQSPASLHQAVLLIEKYRTEGVYVHCALGLSRSVLVIWAWQLFKGKSNQEAVAQLVTIRPRYVQSKYMQINIELYQVFLEAQPTRSANII